MEDRIMEIAIGDIVQVTDDEDRTYVGKVVRRHMRGMLIEIEATTGSPDRIVVPSRFVEAVLTGGSR